MRICYCLVFGDFVKHDLNIFYARYNPHNNPYNILFNDSYNFYLNDLNDHALRRLWVHQTHNIAHSYYQQVGITVHVDCRIYSNSNL